MNIFWQILEPAILLPGPFLARLAKHYILVAVVGCTLLSLIFGVGIAQKAQAAIMDAFSVQEASFPVAEDRTPSRTLSITVTAYTSDPAETDSTPTITASGTTVRPGVIASNDFPIGTRIRIPELFGNQVFVVEDRMNSRFRRRVDIWMEQKKVALAFGVRQARIELY